MDIEQIRICRQALLKEASRLGKLINDHDTVTPDWEEIMMIYGCDIISFDLVDASHLADLLQNDGRGIATRSMGFTLRSLGYSPIKSRRIKMQDTRKNHYIWFDPAKITEQDAILKVRQYHKKKAP